MDSRWQQIERIYHAARELDASARPAFLAKACAGDPALREEVESLLAQDENLGSFLQSPAIELAAEDLVKDQLASDSPRLRFEPGTMVNHYRLTGKLGAGGMGEVYRARDTRLQRDVALKFLPSAMARDAERMARFKREAQVLASLNHPNIAAIHGLEESNGIHALVIELVEGETLSERLSVATIPPGRNRGPLSSEKPGVHRAPLQLDDALPIAKQIAEALECAHERGVIHRDLKPANVKITPEGTVKVLDFGLAKVLIHRDPVAATDPADSPTLSAVATEAGMIMGTAAYMSPEQAKGQRVDRRCDIWAFGCVLYEMLAGWRPFEGETISDVLAAVLMKEPDWNALPATTPPGIQKLVRRCLVKDPKQRLRDIGDARIAVEEALGGTDSVAAGGVYSGEARDRRPSLEEAAAHRLPLRRALPLLLAGLLAGVLISSATIWRFVARVRESPRRFSAVTNFAGVQAQPTLSPDGRSLAFVSNRDGDYNIYVGLVRGGNLIQITHDSNLESRPRWSPDGTTLAYARLNQWGIWDIWEVPALGGTPRRVILNAADPAWSPDGNLLTYENTADGALWISSISGENAHELVPVQARALQNSQPCFSGDGRMIAFTTKSAGPYGELEAFDLSSGKVRQLTDDTALALSPAWSPDGRFVYFASSRGGTMNLWKVAGNGGEPEQITSGQGDDAQLDVASDGKRIVFSTWRENINTAMLDLDAKPGQQNLKLLTTDPARNQVAPVYSPDGKHLAYFSNSKGIERESIWVADADGLNPVELVQDGRINIFPQWTPENQRLVYLSRSQVAPQRTDEYRSVAVSGGMPQTTMKNATDLYFDVGPQGRLLFRGPGDQIQTFDPPDGRTSTLAALPAGEKCRLLRWSSDGRSVAYIVDAAREDDPNAGLWVDDFKSPRRQVFRGWVVWYARGPANVIYLLAGHPDLNGVLWKVCWDGHGLTRTSTTIRLIYSYWVNAGQNSQVYLTVSPDGSRLAFNTQEVLQANIGMIENMR